MARLQLLPPARAVVALVVAGLVLNACRVDADVAVVIDRNGAGTITVTLTADAEIVAEQPDLATQLRTVDLAAAGWEITPPAPTADGGLRLLIRRGFATVEEANALLAQLGNRDGPFVGLDLTQDRGRSRIATGLTGALLVPTTGTFADAEVIALLGALPYSSTLAQRGLALDKALGLTFSVTVPGEVVETDGTADPSDSDAQTTTVRWTAALGGGALSAPGQPLTLQALLDDPGARQAQRVRDFTVWALPAWLVFFGFVVLPVVYLRRRR
jgi:hypothetical protein